VVRSSTSETMKAEAPVFPPAEPITPDVALRPIAPAYTAGVTAPPAVLASNTVSSTFFPTVPAHLPAVSMPSLSMPVPSSLAHIGPATGRRPVLEVGTERLLEPPEPDALCPALILTRGEAEVNFMMALSSIQRLCSGDYPVEILGPSGRALLHARLPSSPTVGSPETPAGFWLELCTTPTSNFPHGSIGPLFPGIRAEYGLEIRGPSGQVFGTLEPTVTGWCVQRRNQVLLNLELDFNTSELKTIGPDGRLLALASPTNDEAMQIQMDQGIDALLNLIVLLAALLISYGQVG